MRAIAFALLAATCNTTPPGPAPTSVADPPAVITATPSPDPVQNPADCDAACVQAQSACTNPLPVAHCVSVCEAAAHYLAAPGVTCIAKVATCNVECLP